MNITGRISDRKVFINGKELSPTKSQKVWDHSPDGFHWGYLGSGPAQLALAILLEFITEEEAIPLYQSFKQEVIASLRIDEDFVLSDTTVKEWLAQNGRQ